MTYQKYFQSFDNYFWQWEDQGKAIAIPNSTTISLKEYIQEVLSELAPQGLPPFGSLLLAIIATNQNGASSIDSVYTLMHYSLSNSQNTTLNDAIHFLKLLSELPSEVKSGQKRILLLQSIFKVCHNQFSVQNSKAFAKALPNADIEKLSIKQPFNHTMFNRDFNALALLKKKLNSVTAITNCMTGLPAVPADLFEFEIEENRGKTTLIEQLISIKETFLAGTLIKHLWASLNIPFHHKAPSQQPFGGIADITNKGALDKLLISEFANDNDVFLSRLANNETLFYNREVPPSKNDYQRIILIDVSLKNWGTIKTISFAIMIAIATHPKSKISCQAIIVGDSFKLIKIDNINGILEGLSILGSNLNSSLGLKSFFEETDLKNKEIIFIASQESLEHPEIEKIINENIIHFDYWLTPTQIGSVSIFKRQNKSKKLINTIFLPLKYDVVQDPIQLGKALELKNYPILFHEPLNMKKAVYSVETGLYKITKDKVLFRIYDKTAPSGTKGWALCFENLIHNYDEYAIGMNEDKKLVLLMYTTKFREVILLDLESGKSKKIPFTYGQNSPYQKWFFEQNLFHYIHSNFFITIDFEGNVLKHEKPTRYLIKNYTEASQTLKKAIGSNPHKRQLFKNASFIFINENSELVFDTNRLHLTDQETIKIQSTNSLKKKFNAIQNIQHEFVFADGSKVEIKNSGMIILKSSNLDLPNVFIPSILADSLGVATFDFFAGNEYYFISTKYELTLSKISNKKIEIIKAIKPYLNVGLLEINKLVDNCPCIINKEFNNSQSFNLKKELELLGAVATIKSIGTKQTQIETAKFYKFFIKTFLETIIKHGN